MDMDSLSKGFFNSYWVSGIVLEVIICKTVKHCFSAKKIFFSGKLSIFFPLKLLLIIQMQFYPWDVSSHFWLLKQCWSKVALSFHFSLEDSCPPETPFLSSSLLCGFHIPVPLDCLAQLESSAKWSWVSLQFSFKFNMERENVGMFRAGGAKAIFWCVFFPKILLFFFLKYISKEYN